MSRNGSRADRAFRRYCETREPAAVAELFDLVAADLLLAAAHCVRDAATAEDLVQTTFLHAIEAADRFDLERPVMPWLMKILANRVADEGRRRQRRFDAGRVREDQVVDPAEAVVDREVLEILTAAIERMPSQYRDVLNLRMTRGMTPTEIAHALGRPLATVKSQLRRGLERMRGILPAGLASSLAVLLLPERGLAAIRASVLGALDPVRPVVASGMGVIAVKKLVGVVVALVLVVLAWNVDLGIGDVEPVEQRRVRVADAITSSVDDTMPDPPSRTAVSTSELERGGVGAIRVRLVWDEDDSSAEGIGVGVVADDPAASHWTTVRLETDADGRTEWLQTEPGRYRVVVARDQELVLSIAAGEVAEPMLRVRRYGTVEGYVLDHDGRPVAEAEVCTRISAHPVSSVVARTDADGRFAAPLWASRTELIARAPGRGVSTDVRVYSVPHETHRVVLMLGAGAVPFEGVVVGVDGAPVAGARVALDMEKPRFGNTTSCEERVTADVFTTTGSDGRFRFANVLPGDVDLRVEANGCAPWSATLTKSARGESVRVELTPGAKLVGQVVDRSGSPVGSAIVSAVSLSLYREIARVVADATGRFVLDGLPSESLDVHLDSRSAGSSIERVAVDATQVTEVRFELDPGLRLHGEVVRADGSPARDVEIVVRADTGQDRFRLPARTDDDGAFVIPQCIDSTYTVEVRERHADSSVVRAVVPGLVPTRDGRRQRIELDAMTRPGSAVVGRIVPSPGTVLQSLRVQLRPLGQGGAGRSVATRASDGGFRFDRLRSGRYRLETAAIASQPAQSLAEFELGVDEVLDLESLECESVAPVELRCVGAVPPLPVSVLIEGSDGRIAFTGSWYDGWLGSCPRLAPGTWRIRVLGSATNVPWEATVEHRRDRPSTVEFDVPNAVPVAFELVGDAELPEVLVAGLERLDGETARTAVVFSGTGTTTAALVPGVYSVRVRHDVLSGEAEFRVIPGGSGDAVRLEVR